MIKERGGVKEFIYYYGRIRRYNYNRYRLEIIGEK